MGKVENGIVINLSIGMNVMSLCVKVRQVNFSEPKPWNGNTNTLEKSWEICRKNLGEEIQMGEKNDSFGEIQIGAETNLQSVFIIFYYTALEKYHPGVFHPYLVRIGGVETWKVKVGVPFHALEDFGRLRSPQESMIEPSNDSNASRNQVRGGNCCGPQK